MKFLLTIYHNNFYFNTTQISLIMYSLRPIKEGVKNSNNFYKAGEGRKNNFKITEGSKLEVGGGRFEKNFQNVCKEQKNLYLTN